MANVTDVLEKLKNLQTTEVEALSKRGLDPTVCQNLGLKSTQMGGGESKVAQAYKRKNKIYAYKIRPVSGKGDHFWKSDGRPSRWA